METLSKHPSMSKPVPFATGFGVWFCEHPPAVTCAWRRRAVRQSVSADAPRTTNRAFLERIRSSRRTDVFLRFFVGWNVNACDLHPTNDRNASPTHSAPVKYNFVERLVKAPGFAHTGRCSEHTPNGWRRLITASRRGKRCDCPAGNNPNALTAVSKKPWAHNDHNSFASDCIPSLGACALLSVTVHPQQCINGVLWHATNEKLSNITTDLCAHSLHQAPQDRVSSPRRSSPRNVLMQLLRVLDE